MWTKQELTEFLNTIKSCHRRINAAAMLQYFTVALLIGGVAALLFQAAAFVLPIYYVNLYSAAALLLAALTALLLAFFKRIPMEKAALAIDGFGFEERIITAYENRAKEGVFVERQRADAIKQLKQNKGNIRISLCPNKKLLAGLSCLLILILICSLLPSPVKQQAKELHELRQEVREKEKEIEDMIEAVEELAQEELSPEELASLQDMLDSLRSSLSEYQQAGTEEALAAANNRLDYKYSDMSSQLADLAESLKDGAAPSLAAAQAMENLSQQLQSMSADKNGQQLASNNNGNGNQDNNGQNSNNGTGNDNGQNANGGNGNNGQNANGSGDGNNGQGGSNGNAGNGDGRGTGTANNPHDYVSVPNAIADSDNLTGNANGSQNSEYYRAPNGLSWEGNHVSYETVIGNYQRHAYEGIAAGRYPSGMEEVIKGYFSSFN
ncbi:MAG: hypothetical protein NC081_08535 [Roseburia sp.]|nr:hypothetical protein [Roseburia sp.]